jgi:acyl-CoA synthetase (AMP-forming)/AMP-acid ligase II
MLTLEVHEPLRSVLPSLRKRFREEGWWGDETFASRAESWALRDPDRLAVRDDRMALTRGQLIAQARSFAMWLLERGIGRGGVVALQVPNCADYAVANLGCELAGAVWVNLSPAYRRHEMMDILGHLRADVLVVETAVRGFDMRPLVNEVVAETSVVAVVGHGDDIPSDWTSFAAALELEPDDAVIDRARLGADDVYSVVLSSGTTSARPKEALRSINSMFCALTIMNRSFAVDERDRILVLAPQTGGAGYSYSVALPALTGAQADVTELPIGAAILERIGTIRPTVLVAVPTQMGRLLDAAHGDRSIWSDLRLIINSGAPLLGEVAARAEEECGCPIVSVYGATDGMVPVITATDAPAEERRSRVGRLMDGHHLRIIDDEGQVVPAGTVGEICAFGPGMAFGYVDNPQEMMRAWDESGWWHSGDLGLLDEDGYLRVVGRRKELILRGGVNISPLEIEELLNKHPDVVEAVAVPIPHADLLEQVCAVVIPQPGRTPTLELLNAFLTECGLARFKLPERLELFAEIPRTNMQKIDRTRLCEELGVRVTRESQAKRP